MAFLKAKRREKDLARDTSSEVTTICSNLYYILYVISATSKPHNIGSIIASSAYAIFSVDDVMTKRFNKNY